MKKNKAFTLVELLAVIAILMAIILIATKAYQTIMYHAKKEAFKSDAQMILKAANLKKADDPSFDITALTTDNLESYLGIKDENYNLLTITLNSNDYYIFITGYNKWEQFVACGTQYNMYVYPLENASSCPLGGSGYIVDKAIDSDPGDIDADGNGTGNGTSKTGASCTTAMEIESVEDLVYFAKRVNTDAYNYSGKCIKLKTDLDINSKNSYANYKTVVFGDINGNGLTEGLRTELTKAAGFIPIGTSARSFNGTFVGEQHYLYNLFINRPATNDIGLFGYNRGTLSNLKLINANVVGYDYVGGLIGQNWGTVYDQEITGNVSGHNDIGLLAGYAEFYKHITSVTVEGNASGNDNVGGIVGYDYYSTIRGINKGGTITSVGGNAGRLIGNDPYGFGRGISINTVTVNGSTINSTTPVGKQGLNITSLSSLNNLYMADIALDTYIAGDNDSDGYYWDLDEDQVLVKKTTSNYPLTFGLSGSGASGDPYVINTPTDLKRAALKLSSQYIVNSNIDMTDQLVYPIGSFINPFTGTFNGNSKIISNLAITASNTPYVGLFGYNNGTIKNLNIATSNAQGGNYTGILVGQNDGTVITTNIEGDATGINYVGLLAGYNNGTITSATVEGDAQGVNAIGGLTGYTYVSATRAINKGGSIVATGGSDAGRIVGAHYSDGGCVSALGLTSVTVNGSTVSSSIQYGRNGLDLTSLNNLNNLVIAEVALDTYIGGDNDSDGFYWDYDGSYNVVRKSTSTDPLTFGLSGSGTTGDPYLISDYTDLKQASLQLNKVYKLTSDINLSGEKIYIMGSNINRFSGTFDGNSKTLSNINMSVTGTPYIGLFGYNTGTIKDLNLTTAEIIGGNYTGVIAGYTSGNITNSNVTGDVTGSNHVGLIAGKTDGGISSVTVEGDAIGYDYVGGITGSTYVTNVQGLNKGGTVTNTKVGGTNIGRAVGSSYLESFASNLALTSITVNGSTVSSVNQSSRNGSNLASLNDLNNIIVADVAFDTYIGGDNNGDGYYWDYDGSYNIVRKNTSTDPLTFSLSGSGTTGDPYLISNYTDLKQASLQLNKVYKLTADINLSGAKYYNLGTYINKFTGTFDGNAKTISNLTINCPTISYVGLIGYNNGTVKGLNLTSINITGGNYTGGIAGQSESAITDVVISGTVSGASQVGLGAGKQNGLMNGVIVEGTVSGSNPVGGIAGSSYVTNVKGINRGGTITGSGSVARCVGSPYLSSYVDASALTSVTVNGSTVTSSNQHSPNGLDVTAGDLQVEATYTNRGFNFTNETLDYIWYFDGGVAKFREGAS